ncbi:O-antigen ligase [uncultured Aquimarina sp.]|uniref:O-antigen ligase family protein n=1 Tax=uncultured Aquimarina sp. TaxID=575652 RepID=UPI00260C7F2F|nr:O-antigen ligase family protein [uncultured Aquimarina sp.]
MSIEVTSYYEKLHFFLICALSFFPILPRGVHSTLIIIVTVLALLYFLLNGRKFWTTKKTLRLISLGSLSVIYIGSLFHLDNFDSGAKMIVRTAPILLLPFSFLLLNIQYWNKQKLKIVLYLYIAVNFLLLSYLHISFFEIIYYSKITSWEIRSIIEESIDVHGTYLSLWISFAVLSTLWLLFKTNKSKIIIGIKVLLMIYFLYWLYILGARMPLFGTTIAFAWLLLSLLKVSRKHILLIFSLLLFTGSLVFWKPVLEKIQEVKNYENAIPPGKYENTYPLISNEDIRSVIYYCASQKIIQKPIFGYGIGNVNIELQQCYDLEFGYTDLFTRFHFNSHSQYLQVFLAAGIVGLLAYLLSVFLWIRWSLIKLYIPFLLLTFLCLVFENILSRHDGVIFFSFFNSILFFSENKEN